MKDSEKGDKSMEGRKEMFYLTTHSTHFNYGYMASEKSMDEQSGGQWMDGRVNE